MSIAKEKGHEYATQNHRINSIRATLKYFESAIARDRKQIVDLLPEIVHLISKAFAEGYRRGVKAADIGDYITREYAKKLFLKEAIAKLKEIE